MYLDGALMFDNPSTLAIAAGTQASANTIDLLNARDIGLGDSPTLKVWGLVTTAFTSGGAGTLQAAIQGSTDNSTWITMSQTRAFALAELAAGSRILNEDMPRVEGTQAVPRYIRILWTVGAATMTAGAVIAGMNLNIQQNTAYAPGVTVTN